MKGKPAFDLTSHPSRRHFSWKRSERASWPLLTGAGEAQVSAVREAVLMTSKSPGAAWPEPPAPADASPPVCPSPRLPPTLSLCPSTSLCVSLPLPLWLSPRLSPIPSISLSPPPLLSWGRFPPWGPRGLSGARLPTPLRPATLLPPHGDRRTCLPRGEGTGGRSRRGRAGLPSAGCTQTLGSSPVTVACGDTEASEYGLSPREWGWARLRAPQRPGRGLQRRQCPAATRPHTPRTGPRGAAACAGADLPGTGAPLRAARGVRDTERHL